MFLVNGRSIRISAGDTGVIRFEIEGPALGDKDRGVFTVKNQKGDVMIKKIIAPEKPDEICVPFVNSDTEKMAPGTYEWDIRVVFGAKMGAGGDVVDGENVVTPYAPGQFSVMKVVGSV